MARNELRKKGVEVGTEVGVGHKRYVTIFHMALYTHE